MCLKNTTNWISVIESNLSSSLCILSTCLLNPNICWLPTCLWWSLSLGSWGNLDWWSWMIYSFLQAAQQQICISRQLIPTGHGDVNCIFHAEFFSGLSRSQGTKTGILLPSPTLDLQSASVHANNSKFPEESTIQHWTMFTLQGPADAPPQMVLDNPEFILSMSSLLEKALQNRHNTHALEKLLDMVTPQATPCRCPNTQWDPLHWTDQALFKM